MVSKSSNTLKSRSLLSNSTLPAVLVAFSYRNLFASFNDFVGAFLVTGTVSKYNQIVANSYVFVGFVCAILISYC